MCALKEDGQHADELLNDAPEEVTTAAHYITHSIDLHWTATIGEGFVEGVPAAEAVDRQELISETVDRQTIERKREAGGRVQNKHAQPGHW